MLPVRGARSEVDCSGSRSSRVAAKISVSEQYASDYMIAIFTIIGVYKVGIIVVRVVVGIIS